MNFDQLLAAVDELTPEERDRLKAYLAQQEPQQQPRTIEDWLAKFQDIANEFRGDSSDEEMRQIIEAMTLKSKPSNKGV